MKQRRTSQGHCGLAAVGVGHTTRAQGGDGARQKHGTLPQLHQEKAHRAASGGNPTHTDLKTRVIGITTITQSCISGEVGGTQN